MSTELALLSTSSPIALRSAVVLAEILAIKSTLMKRALQLGRLLREARDNNYAFDWGFARFSDWVEQGSGLDMSARSAYDLIKLIEQSERLCISDDQLERVKISKLKAIFTLKDGEMSDDEIRTLVTQAETKTLVDIKEEVAIAKDQFWVYKTYKFDKTAYEAVVEPAIQRAIREYGDTITEEEEVADISDSKGIEIICADFSAGPETEYGVVLDGEFEDVFEIGASSGSIPA